MFRLVTAGVKCPRAHKQARTLSCDAPTWHIPGFHTFRVWFCGVRAGLWGCGPCSGLQPGSVPALAERERGQCYGGVGVWGQACHPPAHDLSVVADASRIRLGWVALAQGRLASPVVTSQAPRLWAQR